MYQNPPNPPPRGYQPPPQANVYKPQNSGKKAVVAMNIQVLVEVDDTGSYADMVEQAKIDIAKRVVEARTFLPMQMKSDRVYSDVTVSELKTALVVTPGTRWSR